MNEEPHMTLLRHIAEVASTKVVYEPVRSGVSLPND